MRLCLQNMPLQYLNNEDKNGKDIRIQDVLGGRIIEKKSFYYLFFYHVFISVF
ncbi:hypothetical protein D2M30_4270 [Bacillus amyloliquefaciens]|nr:hypothetical protein D2M30_4270 [Bacillus amyloliquefaciens]